MKLRLIYSCFVMVALLFSCNDLKKKNSEMTPENAETADNSQNSLDWAGTYEGVLPCADCEGIKTVITINEDNTYVIKEFYQGKSDSLLESSGSFKWDETGQQITFPDKNPNSYAVGENTLTHLDIERKKITGDLADNYILTKVNDALVGKKWHLVSFKGKEIQLTEAKAEHPFVEFADDLTITGYTGCNNLRGGYALGDAQKISFSKLLSTKKFCPEMATENEFLATLNSSVYFSFENHALVIYDENHHGLATFKAAN